MPVALDASDRCSDDLRRALASRIVATCDDVGSEVDLTYEVRERPSGLDVVRLDASSCELIDAADGVDAAAELIANDVHRWVAEHHPDLLVVHAGVVEWMGVGIVVPGRSHTGKTSLVAAMLDAGARYLSDEFAPIDRDGRVHPYPRHLALRDGEGTSALVPAMNFSAPIATEPIPVGYVVDARYVPGATFRPTEVHGAATLMCLADNALVARSRPAHTMAVVAGLVPDVTVLRSDRGDAAAAARCVLDRVDVARRRSR